MTYVIGSACIDVLDKSCLDVCPVDCIYFEDGVDRMLFIDPVDCILCGACAAVCPVEAIDVEEDFSEEEQEFISLNAQWFESPEEVRQRINEICPA